MRVAVVDYGAGNLHSVVKALAAGGVDVRVEADPRVAVRAGALVLPGVGAFGAASARLAPAREVLRDALAGGLPCLGICLGMQLLFEASEEGAGPGVGFFAGRVRRLRAARLPQLGWNTLEDAADPVLVAAALRFGYYANSFVCEPRDPSVVTAWSALEGDRFAAAVRSGRTVGVQFHPEKSGAPGLALIRAFLGDAA